MNIRINDTQVTIEGNNQYEDAFLELKSKDLLGKSFKLYMPQAGELCFELVEGK
jgi:hypothetical protein